MSDSKTPGPDVAISDELCNACGLCCNGAIFANVQLRSGDDEMRLRSLGLRIKTTPGGRRASRFFQPCAAHDGCRCRIYAERPEYCREFECSLLKSVIAGRMEKAAALGLISVARECLARIRCSLRELGDTDETLSHRVRFKRTALRMEHGDPDQTEAGVFADLTLAVQDLNVLLAESFYPGRVQDLKAE